MQEFGARIAQVQTEAIVALSRTDLSYLFLELGSGPKMFKEEIPEIVDEFEKSDLTQGKRACPKGEDTCAMAGSTHMLKQNGVISKDGESAAQISYRCTACIDLIGLKAASSAAAVDIKGTVNRAKDQRRGLPS